MDYLNPDYDAIFKERIKRLQKIRETPGMAEGLNEFYKDHPKEFISDWGMTYDPRNAEIGQPTDIPFILFPKQEEFVDWVISRWRAREDGLAEKSRDMGVSWLGIAVSVWMWRYCPGAAVGWGSRKEEYVDKLGDPKSLFWKARFYIDNLPREFRPKGYKSEQHAPHMRILNPENKASIIGEAGDNIGRGNRTSIYFKDESAFYEHPESIDAALSQTSNCKIDISTVNGNGNPFYRKRHSGKIPVFRFHWRDDPRKDDAWYKKQVDTLDPVIVASEIDIDYNASVGDAWISGDLIEQAQRIGPAEVEAIGHWVIGVDAAHMGDDKSVVHRRKGRLNLPQKEFGQIDGPVLAGHVEEECRQLEESGGVIGGIVIELDGPGTSCYDQLKRGQYKDKVFGVHTGTRLKDDRNYNLRALLHRRYKEYLENKPASMPKSEAILSQSSSIKYTYRDGLLLMQSKKDYKKMFGRSPDNHDAVVLTFHNVGGGKVAMPTMRAGSWMG